ncbi:YqeH family GTPase [Skeletonema marinoi]|uniref:YqeH family GTPase n=1 Tax=Skeletonema marinoi TaxID=267567 RepID=A0AAD8YPU7_9STRA|nr:YqeH family GTPase [Skeletonema marinoi]
MIRSPLSIILFVTIMKHITALATTRAIIDSSRRTAFRSGANVYSSNRASNVPLAVRYFGRSAENSRTRSIGWAIQSNNLAFRTNIALFSSATDGNDLSKFTVAELKVKLKEKGLPTSGLKAELVERLATAGGSSSTQTQSPKKSAAPGPKKPKQSAKRKIVINPNWKTEFNVKALEDEFNNLAKKEGFNEATAYYADDATFEDDFLEEDYNFDDDDLESDGDDDIPDFGNAGQSMEERLAAAKQDQMTGRVSVPKSLDTFSQEVSFEDLQKLGFRKEVNPFGNDETPRRDQFKIISGSMACSGCGANFQKKDDMRPGFLPEDKFDIQTKLSKIEEVQKMQEKAESADWSPEDEVEWLLREGEPDSEDSEENMLNMSVDEMAEMQGLDLDVLTKKKVLCKRCHGLQNFGTVEQKLRPGWTDEPMLSQEEFRKLLLPLRQKNAVILALVDLFDFSGSVLPELDEIAGDNPVILAANKADLLPSEMGQARAENWVRRELEYLNVQSIANIGGAVRLVSCKTGFGVKTMMEKAKNLAEEMDADIYVVGAANAGKSTLVNYLLDENNPMRKEGFKGKKRAGNANKWKGSVTTSPLPGTTLKFIRIELGKGRALFDTPGLLVPGCLTERLTPEELKIVVPKKRVEPITFRVASGKCVLVGGLAKVELIGDSKPFLFTFFVANDIKLHPTDSERADEFTSKHVGKILTPPLEPGQERLEEIGEFEYHEIDVKGEGWKQAAADITLRGLGWVAVTGAGVAKVRIGVPKGIGITVRPPLMPFDVWEATAKYTGGRAVRKSTKSRSGKRRKGVGRS